MKKFILSISLILVSNFAFAVPTCTVTSIASTYILRTLTAQPSKASGFVDANPVMGKLVLGSTQPGTNTACDGITTNCKASFDGIHFQSYNVYNPAATVAQSPYWKLGTTGDKCDITLYNFNIVGASDGILVAPGSVQTQVANVNLNMRAATVNLTANTTSVIKMNGLWNDNYFTTTVIGGVTYKMGIGLWFGPYVSNIELQRFTQ